MNILVRIKRAVLAGHYRFSAKALAEMDADDPTEPRRESSKGL